MTSSLARTILAGALVMAPMCTLLAAGPVFNDSFESGKIGNWSIESGRNPCIAVTSALDQRDGPKDGAYMLRCNWNGTVSWDDAKRFETLNLGGWKYDKEMLIRFWVRADADAADHPANGPKYFRLGTAGSYASMNFRSGQQMAAFYGNAGQIGTTYWGGGSTAGDGKWHKVEVYVRDGAGDGVVRIWEDDRLIWNITGATTTQPNGWAMFYVTSNWSGADGCCDHDATNHLYWDSFEIYSDLGSGGVGLMSDGTIAVGSTPKAPAEVVVE